MTLWIWKEKRRRRRSSDGVMPIDRLLTNAVFFEDTMYVVQVGFRAGLDDVYGNLSIIRILRLMRCRFVMEWESCELRLVIWTST